MKKLFMPVACVILALVMMIGGSISALAAQESIAETAMDDTTAPAEIAEVGADAGEEMLVPQIHVTTDDGNGTSLQKADGYVGASIVITDTDGTQISDAVQFKVRGNTTAFASVQKKAYAFKFAKKKDVFGMGKGKKWVLLANAYDPSLLRNYLAIDMAQELGLDYTSEQRFVELWVDDSYRGCYTLYEPIQEGSARVDIDIESNDGMKDFLIEYEQLADEEDTTYIAIDGLRFALKEPEEPDEQQLAYITDTMRGIINTMKSGKSEDAESVIDIPSFAKYYLVNEFMKNMDFDMSSVYYYYKDGKLYAGPVWDFDKSSGNTNPDIGSSRALNSYKSDGIMQDQQTLYRYIGRQDWFTSEVTQVYEEHYDYFENIYADGGLLDSLRTQYGEIFDRNFAVWDIKRQGTNYIKPPLATYEANYQYFKNWCQERDTWLSDHYELFSYEYLRGDADGNGEIDILDVTSVQRKLAQLPCQDDGKLNLRGAVCGTELTIADATAIQRYLVNLGDNKYQIETTNKVRLR